MKSKIKITDDLKWILNRLNSYGKGYIVGGYIRDYLLGIEPKDCDFCTDIDYEKLKVIFAECSPKEIGKAFGIIQIIYNGKSYEIAKLRREIGFTENRNVVEVEFVSDIYEDLKRRDFTVNAIAFDGERIIYPSNESLKDIENRILRFVGEGEERIKEDPLRILRGIRIAGEKKLFILKSVEDNMIKNKKEIQRVSIERVQDEIFKMLKGENRVESFYLLNKLQIFEELFPETSKKMDLTGVLDKIKQIDRLNLELAIIFFKSKEELSKLKLDNKSKKSILNIINQKENFKNIKTKYDVKKMISLIGLEDFKDILVLEKLEREISNLEIFLKEILENNEPIFLKDLVISGKDIISLGVTDGKKIKLNLERCLESVLQNPRFNSRNYLMKLIKEEKN
ncbi:MAG: CCA tRNA nucleotidyltransferase [Cetobacterium sp.]|uniref:CCA tRNA nucleotidyltransferase n=1 Tax=Cetobacterium sp. ZOR0034 TaxID=1339239 RepID=UPI000647D7F7|nr:CCA tRNA nucleotidyltransferase [Cetobacterium sp. ZOR0034]